MSSSPLCPSCNKRVYFAERQYYKGTDYHQICYNILIKKEAAAAPKTFAIHEQIFCNVEENSKHKYPLAPKDGYYTAPAVVEQPKQDTRTVKERLNTVSSVNQVVSTPSGFNFKSGSSSSSSSSSSQSPSSPSSSPKSQPPQQSSSPKISRPSGCTKCSSELRPTDKFCTSCGTKVVA